MVVTAIGVAIEEALASIGMVTSDAVVHLEYGEDADGLPAAMAQSYPTQQCSQWAEAGLEENLTMAVDWLIAVYPGPAKYPGSTKDEEKRSWARNMTAFADSLAVNCGLGSALFLSSIRLG